MTESLKVLAESYNTIDTKWNKCIEELMQKWGIDINSDIARILKRIQEKVAVPNKKVVQLPNKEALEAIIGFLNQKNTNNNHVHDLIIMKHKPDLSAELYNSMVNMLISDNDVTINIDKLMTETEKMNDMIHECVESFAHYITTNHNSPQDGHLSYSAALPSALRISPTIVYDKE